MSVPRQDSECICVLGVSNFLVHTIFVLDFCKLLYYANVPTVWYVFFISLKKISTMQNQTYDWTIRLIDWLIDWLIDNAKWEWIGLTKHRILWLVDYYFSIVIVEKVIHYSYTHLRCPLRRIVICLKSHRCLIYPHMAHTLCSLDQRSYSFFQNLQEWTRTLLDIYYDSQGSFPFKKKTLSIGHTQFASWGRIKQLCGFAP